MSINSPTTIHTSRTLMFKELSKVMDYAIHDDTYLQSLQNNIANKQTKTNQDKTTGYLKSLYTFDIQNPYFLCLKYFWPLVVESEKPLLALLFAVGKDFLLSESLDVVLKAPAGLRLPIEQFEVNIESLHPGRYSLNTKHSVAQNLASSWKQAGYIKGKVKNIRTRTAPSFLVVTFAILLSYIFGDRGDFLLQSKWTRALAISESSIRELLIEAAKRDLLQYQYAGNVTFLSFDNLLLKLDKHGLIG